MTRRPTNDSPSLFAAPTPEPRTVATPPTRPDPPKPPAPQLVIVDPRMGRDGVWWVIAGRYFDTFAEADQWRKDGMPHPVSGRRGVP